ncbi:hypothetical protein EDM76_11365 [bacterium]|nr:MAG: hypothetical protein EDM76_11365 [bacterium]
MKKNRANPYVLFPEAQAEKEEKEDPADTIRAAKAAFERGDLVSFYASWKAAMIERKLPLDWFVTDRREGEGLH